MSRQIIMLTRDVGRQVRPIRTLSANASAYVRRGAGVATAGCGVEVGQVAEACGSTSLASLSPGSSASTYPSGWWGALAMPPTCLPVLGRDSACKVGIIRPPGLAHGPGDEEARVVTL